ncbi:Thiamine biosynthesis lipoprotein ApbE [Sphingomonas gellani]|uniref:FAD:protein FMN transferase n=1 Tax=Sphingomonas gellani TaxID=1166340 RepID=A0A1H8DB34_9SPHN|nr:FAD:protein FMN transferase [Sphingomonas gellani]SEN04024.1 Thiamine biosynthesis lipoprotein ApbE [Sphingomonas gellani]
MAVLADVERFAAMGTRVELHRFGEGDPAALAGARRAIEAVDDALTIHRPSATTVLNERLLAGQEAAVDDPLLLKALVTIDEAHRATLGLFDPAADRRLGAAGWGDILLDREAGRIRAATPLALDFGGFGKGFALDLACVALRAAGVRSACLSAGESSIAVVGEHPLGGGWPFAIPHPLRPGQTLLELELNDEAMSISSTVGAGVDAPERAPMIRPGYAAPVTRRRCTVAIDRLGARAEAMSTALIVADDDRAIRLLSGRPNRNFLFDLSQEAAMPVPPSRMSLQ